jgi:hypothetical protein
MSVLTLLAGIGGALIGLLGVGAGAWLQGRKEQQRWLRDQKLHAAIEVIAATGELYERRRTLLAGMSSSIDERATYARLQDGRSALHLLCRASTVDAAEALIIQVRRELAEADPDEDAIAMLRELVGQLRAEIGNPQLGRPLSVDPGRSSSALNSQRDDADG